MAEALIEEPALSGLVVVTAIRLGASPRAIETALHERQGHGRVDPLVTLAHESSASLTLLHELVDRWGLAENRESHCEATGWSTP